MTNSQPLGQRKEAQVSLPDIILVIADIYRTIYSRLGQYVENSLDAGADIDWIVLERDRIVNIDNGHGMIPFMLKEDADRLREFLKTGKNVKANLDDIIPLDSASRKIFEFMMLSIARSAKNPGQTGVRGMRGVGFWTYLTFARFASVISRPILPLAEKYWGTSITPEQNESFRLNALNKDQLHDEEHPAYSIDESPTHPTDPWGNVLDHGTRVEITGFDTGNPFNDVPELISRLQRTYAGDLKAGKRIVVVNRLGENEEIIELQPPKFTGAQILDRQIRIHTQNYGSYTVHVVLYFDPSGHAKTPEVIWKNKSVFPLTELNAFKTSPWNENGLNGTVEFMETPHDAVLWNSEKENINTEHPLYKKWVQEIGLLVPAVIREIEKLRQQSGTEGLEALVRDLMATTQEALEADPIFRDLVVGTVPEQKKSGGENGQKPTGKIRRRASGTHPVTASVRNQWGYPQRRVGVQLFRSKKYIDKKLTGTSGHVTFGEQPFARDYRLKLVLPPKAKGLISQAEQHFHLDEENPGFQGKFIIETDEPNPGDRTRTPPKARLIPLDDPNAIYANQLLIGFVDINQGEPHVLAAFRDRDEVSQILIMAISISHAITEHKFPHEDPEFVLQTAARLAVDIAARQMMKLREKKKAMLAEKKRTDVKRRASPKGAITEKNVEAQSVVKS